MKLIRHLRESGDPETTDLELNLSYSATRQSPPATNMPLRKLFITGLLALTLLAAWPQTTFAATLQILPECARAQQQYAPSLACAIQTFGNIAQVILGLSGSLTLLFFIWGGFLMLVSAGDPKKVDQGKEMIKGALTGLVVILTAGLLVNYGLSRLVRSPDITPVGASCTGCKVNPKGEGIFVLTPDQGIKCIEGCEIVGDKPFKCDASPASPEKCFASKACKVSDSGQQQLCCPQ